MNLFPKQIKHLKHPTVKKICEWIDIHLSLYDPQIIYTGSCGTVYIDFTKRPGNKLRVSSGNQDSTESIQRWNIATHLDYIRGEYRPNDRLYFYGRNQLNKFIQDFMRAEYSHELDSTKKNP